MMHINRIIKDYVKLEQSCLCCWVKLLIISASLMETCTSVFFQHMAHIEVIYFAGALDVCFCIQTNSNEHRNMGVNIGPICGTVMRA